MIRKITGYAIGGACFLIMVAAIIMASIIVLDLIGVFGPSDVLGTAHYACAIFLLSCPFIDNFALGRTIRRLEAFANCRTLIEHEKVIGM
jgi:hypothetical protein